MTARHSLQPLADALGVSLASLGRHVGVSGTQWKEYRDIGVTERVADRLAVKVGLHPFVVWPELAEAAIAAAATADAAEEAARIERRRARWRRAAAKRRALDAEHREQQRRYLADYRAAYREHLNAQRRARYRANRDHELARQAAYDRTHRAAARAERRKAA